MLCGFIHIHNGQYFTTLFLSSFVTVFTEATNVNHADGISRHRLTPYDVHTLQYKYDYTIMSGFQSQCKRMWDLKLFNVVQLTQFFDRLFQLSTILLLKAIFLISSLHRLLNNFLDCPCLQPSSGTKNQIFIHSVIFIQNLKSFN